MVRARCFCMQQLFCLVSQKSPQLRYDPDASSTAKQDVARFTKISEIECDKCRRWSEHQGSLQVQAALHSYNSDASDSDAEMEPEHDVLLNIV